jgi:hypothetical protein
MTESEAQAVFRDHSPDLPIAALFTDRAMETWYHFFIA